MAAGVLLLAAELLELLPAFDEYPFSELALTALFIFQQALYLIGLILLVVGLTGLYVNQWRAAGALGLVGFLAALVGTVFFTGFFWANIFVAPALAIGSPEFLDLGGRFPGFFVSLYIYAIGWLLFGVTSLKGRVYPRVPLIVLMVGAALDLLASPLSGVVLDVGFIWVGLSLFLGKSVATQSPAPEV